MYLQGCGFGGFKQHGDMGASLSSASVEVNNVETQSQREGDRNSEREREREEGREGGRERERQSARKKSRPEHQARC